LKKVLVIDDDNAVRQTVSTALTLNGFEVTEFDNGDAAIREMASHFDLVICDLFMPDTDGVATILAIRKTHPATPIILVTGGGRHFPVGGGGLEDLLKSVEFFGVTHFLMKPFRPSQLIDLVKRALGPAVQ
jgi:DNA-binding NtrC family response regulator